MDDRDKEELEALRAAIAHYGAQIRNDVTLRWACTGGIIAAALAVTTLLGGPLRNRPAIVPAVFACLAVSAAGILFVNVLFETFFMSAQCAVILATRRVSELLGRDPYRVESLSRFGAEYLHGQSYVKWTARATILAATVFIGTPLFVAARTSGASVAVSSIMAVAVGATVSAAIVGLYRRVDRAARRLLRDDLQRRTECRETAPVQTELLRADSKESAHSASDGGTAHANG